MSTVYKIAWAEIERVAPTRAAGYLKAITELGTIHEDENGVPQYVLLPDYYYDAIKAKYNVETQQKIDTTHGLLPHADNWFKITADKNPLP